MKYKVLLLASLIFLSFNGVAQTLITIEDEAISTEEFLNMYNKNNNTDSSVPPLPMQEYLELYINFKLKVKEAEKQGLDKDASFVREYNSYRDQLLKPQLLDNETIEKLVAESYNNMKNDIRASHILINLAENAIGTDTIVAWKKIMDIRNKCLQGENFNDLAYKFSEDPSAREREIDGIKYPANKGDLGYFSAFDMIYPFEHVAYKTKIREVSMPVRSKFGYHIIYVEDIIPALGECEVAHILINVPSKSDSAKVLDIATKLYQRIISGENFDTIAKYNTDDKTTANRGGKLLPFTSNRIDATFIKNIYPLQINEVCKPFFTPYGCHIVKMLKKGKVGSFEDEKETIKNKISKSDRSQLQNEIFINSLKKDYNFTLMSDNYHELLPLIEKHYGNLSVLSANPDKILFTYKNSSVTQQNFINYLFLIYNETQPKFSVETINKQFNSFVNNKLIEQKTEDISQDNNEFKSLLQEYYDGILLFNINDQIVWKRSINDSIGLNDFYNENKDNYLWQERVEAKLYTIEVPSEAKKIRKAIVKGVDDDSITKIFVSPVHVRQVKIENRKYEPNDNTIIDKFDKKTGVSRIIYDNNKAYIAVVSNILPPQVKKYEECKGLVISDYQNLLEKNWLKELRSKYAVTVNIKELEKISHK